MYFKKLELVGFKSFLNKTTLHFEPGITAVVGPNGCGKSNIFDSIRWVLGEQSVKSLRGSNMEDIIFNGTDSKDPLGMAEVSLAFDNSNKFFPLEDKEVLITRRIFRSGESEYLLNKTQVRLKDILDLLMGTGIGAESYSLIPQGKIDMILSSRPEDRRMVFDEASGITKYKSQKKEAARRLEETEQNLIRVNDIIIEVKRQIGSLERQANKARKYKEVFEELKTNDLKLASLEKINLDKDKREIAAKISQSQAKEAEISGLLRSQEASIYNSQIELKGLDSTILSLKNESLNLDNTITRNSERINLNKERILELETHRQQAIAQLEEANKRLLNDAAKLETFKQEYSCLKNNIDVKTTALKEEEAQLNSISLSIKTSLENISSNKITLLSLAQKIADFKNKVSDSFAQLQIYSARQKRLKIEKAKVQEEKSTLESAVNNGRSEIEKLEQEYGINSLKIASLKDACGELKESLNTIISEAENIEKQKLSMLSHKKFLEELQTKYEDISEAMNAVIYLDKAPQEKINAMVVKIKGPLDPDKETQGPFGSLKLSAEAKPFDIGTDNIQPRLQDMELKIVSLGGLIKEKKSAIQEKEALLCQLQASLRDEELTLGNKKTGLESIEAQLNKINDEEGLITLELAEVEDEYIKADTLIQELKEKGCGLQQQQAAVEEASFNEENNILENNNLKEGLLVEAAKLKTELDALNRRISSDDENLKTLGDRYNLDKQAMLILEKQIEEARQKQESLRLEIEEMGNTVLRANLDIAQRNSSLKEAQEKYQILSQALAGVLKEIDSGKKESDNLKNMLYELQMQSKDIEFKYLNVKEKILQAYKIDIDSLVPEAEGQAQQASYEGLGGEIKKLKEKLDSYGNVNLVAIEEYDELKKRYDFLTQQQNDLITAKESLHEAILKINRTTKKMFLETFDKIRVEFRNYFKMLFNGGDAQVYLVDEGDSLESGIEIICRPPGKKLQNVLLLSGGEKSMSAIALIFAIFKIKPAPFCVLDEIDAALDEANVDRFSRVLQEFSKIAQFIVITHNKKTIANADIMYGITMEESGVSKIVSVKFSPNKPLKTEAHPDTEAIAEPV